MEFLGTPFLIQNTTEGWQVTWDHAVQSTSNGETKESVSFTVVIPRSANLTVAEVQTFAVKRAMELLQVIAKKGKDVQ
ncbi:hypothetical protein ACUTR7_00355 [Delftia sp. NA_296.1]|uniref:hypothetical protein n=1 Tax=Delftia sp. NA_296.1 TaxID=3415648 RepID=UPI0040453475